MISGIFHSGRDIVLEIDAQGNVRRNQRPVAMLETRPGPDGYLQLRATMIGDGQASDWLSTRTGVGVWIADRVREHLYGVKRGA